MANIHGLRNADQLEQSTANRNAKPLCLCSAVSAFSVTVTEHHCADHPGKNEQLPACAENNNICNVNQGEDSEEAR